MRFELIEVRHVPYAHLMTVESLKDCGREWEEFKKNPDIWLYKLNDPRFFALVGMHGKKPVGLVVGKIEDSIAEIDTFFLRRSWRGYFKPLKCMTLALKKFLVQHKIKKIEIEANERNTTKLMKKGFKTGRILVEREVK